MIADPRWICAQEVMYRVYTHSSVFPNIVGNGGLCQNIVLSSDINYGLDIIYLHGNCNDQPGKSGIGGSTMHLGVIRLPHPPHQHYIWWPSCKVIVKISHLCLGMSVRRGSYLWKPHMCNLWPGIDLFFATVKPCSSGSLNRCPVVAPRCH